MRAGEEMRHSQNDCPMANVLRECARHEPRVKHTRLLSAQGNRRRGDGDGRDAVASYVKTSDDKGE